MTAETVNDACEKIRSWLREKLEEGVGDEVKVLFSGPITDTNCKLYITQPNIDGFLVLYYIKIVGKRVIGQYFQSNTKDY